MMSGSFDILKVLWKGYNFWQNVFPMFLFGINMLIYFFQSTWYLYQDKDTLQGVLLYISDQLMKLTKTSTLALTHIPTWRILNFTFFT